MWLTEMYPRMQSKMHLVTRLPFLKQKYGTQTLTADESIEYWSNCKEFRNSLLVSIEQTTRNFSTLKKR